MKIHLPEEIAHYEPELRFFFDLMVRKLHTNRHKGFGDDVTLEDLFKMLNAERIELMDAFNGKRNEGQFELAMEAVDVANFSFLIGLVALRMTKEDFEKARRKYHDERSVS